jgi:hypothetical protein
MQAPNRLDPSTRQAARAARLAARRRLGPARRPRRDPRRLLLAAGLTLGAGILIWALPLRLSFHPERPETTVSSADSRRLTQTSKGETGATAEQARIPPSIRVNLRKSADQPSQNVSVPFTVVVNDGTPSVELKPALIRAIRRDWKGYRLPPAAAIQGDALEDLRLEHPEVNSPYAITGDFNGDGHADAALLLRRDGRSLLAVFHGSAEGRYRAQRLLRAPWSEGLYLLRQAPGPVQFNRYRESDSVAVGALDLATEAIRFEGVATGPQLFYFHAGSYRHVELGE